MDPKLFFNPVSDDIAFDNYKKNSVYNAISINRGRLPELDGVDMAIIGLIDSRSGGEIKKMGDAPKRIREKFYHLKKGSGRYRIVDLGNLRNGPQLDDTYLRLKEVCEFLLEKNILPLIIGGGHDFDFAQYCAYESMDKLVTLINIDAKFDLEDSANERESHIHKIIAHEPNFLFNYSHIAHQSYLVDEKENQLLESLSFDTFRLGVVKENLKEMEPIIRDGDLLSFDLSAIKSSYFPGTSERSVYGLTGEEACQICWYGGLNDKLSSIGFYEYDPGYDTEDFQSAFVISTMMWYFIEGFYNRKKESIFRSNDYLVYEVATGMEPETIRFYKSKLSEKWWMEVPYLSEGRNIKRNRIIPCSYSDYETTCNGELPERWINMQSKII